MLWRLAGFFIVNLTQISYHYQCRNDDRNGNIHDNNTGYKLCAVYSAIGQLLQTQCPESLHREKATCNYIMEVTSDCGEVNFGIQYSACVLKMMHKTLVGKCNASSKCTPLCLYCS